MKLHKFLKRISNFKILRTVYQNRPLNITQITKKLEITVSTVFYSCQHLEKLGLITREIQGRQNIIHLTPRGEQVAIKLNEIEIILYEKHNESRKI